MRSYDSRKETAPEYECTIWEAGRATCAIGAAFKPIRVGQSIFHDDGAGTFNPAPHALDEAVVNEWPGREVGILVSIGTGKRPSSSDANHAQWYDGFLGEFAEARKRLIAKIEGCETIHKNMLSEYLANRGVNSHNYYRLNVEVGVGEFGMNEWHRLAEISTGTRRYLSRQEESSMIQDASAKLAKIFRANIRWERAQSVPRVVTQLRPPEIEMPLAVELPGDIPVYPVQYPLQASSNRTSFDSGPETLTVQTGNPPSPRSSGKTLQPHAPKAQPLSLSSSQLNAQPPNLPPKEDPDRQLVTVASPAYLCHGSENRMGSLGAAKDSGRSYNRIEPPPLPPKTPIPEKQAPASGPRTPPTFVLPYPPDDDDAPPAVNMARKPEYRGR